MGLRAEMLFCALCVLHSSSSCRKETKGFDLSDQLALHQFLNSLQIELRANGIGGSHFQRIGKRGEVVGGGPDLLKNTT